MMKLKFDEGTYTLYVDSIGQLHIYEGSHNFSEAFPEIEPVYSTLNKMLIESIIVDLEMDYMLTNEFFIVENKKVVHADAI